MRKIVIFGATSAIAQAAARLFAARGDGLFLVARNPEKLAVVCADLKVRGAKEIGSMSAELTDSARHAELVKEASRFLGGLDTALIAHGELGEQAAAEKDFAKALSLLDTNFLSYASLLTHLANLFSVQKNGTIAVISSVAGDRGRGSNYVYGSAKAALSTFAAGLRNRLYPSNVHVVTVKPGFVDSPMTAHLKKGPLWASPAKVGKGIVRAIDCRRDVVYLPCFWRLIMCVITSIPEKLFKRLKL